MELRVCNPQKGRLETIEVVFTNENTTWFSEIEDNQGIYSITDWEGGLIVKEDSYNYPLWVYDISREDIGYDCAKTRELYDQH